MIIDVSADCGDKATNLKVAGVTTVIRYYSRDTIRPSKRLSRQESMSFAAAGIRLAIVHEGRFGDKPDNYDRATGVADARYVLDYAQNTIGQPNGSAIYFGIDFDATAAEIKDAILPYFQGLADIMGQDRWYLVGVYGSGATCKAVVDAGLAEFAWLAQSTGWSGYSAFSRSGRWSLKQHMPSTVANVACDVDDLGTSGSCGDFLLPVASLENQYTQLQAMSVNARGGLHLRSGPGAEFGSMKLLPIDSAVYPLKTSGNWTLVDLKGDGRADGYVSAGYLANAGGFIASTPSPPGDDAVHIPEAIRQGQSAAGLRLARERAAASLPGYPTNGCAAHLSALLEDSGIDIAMTLGAGKLAHLIESRGWSRVKVGSQRPGDVGVCFDNDPTPAGADHVYLVVQCLGLDEMLVADNQRTADAPHTRYASGRGKTPTDYFLRA